MTRVRIPPVLREAAGGSKEVELGGATVGEVLDALVERFPGLRDQLFSADGELNRFVNVYLNDEDVRYLSELETPAAERDTVVVLPAMAGGAHRDVYVQTNNRDGFRRSRRVSRPKRVGAVGLGVQKPTTRRVRGSAPPRIGSSCASRRTRRPRRGTPGDQGVERAQRMQPPTFT